MFGFVTVGQSLIFSRPLLFRDLYMYYKIIIPYSTVFCKIDHSSLSPYKSKERVKICEYKDLGSREIFGYKYKDLSIQ